MCHPATSTCSSAVAHMYFACACRHQVKPERVTCGACYQLSLPRSVVTATALSCLCSTLGSGKGIQAKRVEDAYEFYHQNLAFARMVSPALFTCRSCNIKDPRLSAGAAASGRQFAAANRRLDDGNVLMQTHRPYREVLLVIVQRRMLPSAGRALGGLLCCHRLCPLVPLPHYHELQTGHHSLTAVGGILA